MNNNINERIELKHNHDLLISNFFCLPKPLNKTNEYKYFPDYIKTIFTNFKQLLLKFKGETKRIIDENQDYIDLLTNSIMLSVDCYYTGKTNQAYITLKKVLNRKKKFILDWKEPYNYSEPNKKVYRARIDKFFHSINSVNEMFHVPFESRGKIKTHRFSIPGLPCLYLGSSSFVCWQELDFPDINKVKFSKFVFNETKCKIIDLATFPITICKYTGTTLCIIPDDFNTMKERYIKDQQMIANLLIMWPLIFACSIKVKNKDDLFKPEYIIPQLLLQWAVEQGDIDAIKYFSINMKPYFDNNEYISVNYAFPVKQLKENGFCEELSKKFTITLPLSIQDLLLNYPWILSKKEEVNTKEINSSNKKEMVILCLPNRLGGQMYKNTFFGKIEYLLDLEELKIIEKQ